MTTIIQRINSCFRKSELDIDNIEPMRQETHVPKYEAPVVIPGVRGSPRIQYRR